MPALIFFLYAVIELAALVAVGHFFGVVPAILSLIVVSTIGILLIGSQGRRVFAQFRRARAGEITPGTAVADATLVATGGFLMFIPGLVTGLIGLLFLLPPTRFLVRPLVRSVADRRVSKLRAQMPYRGIVIDGEEVVDRGEVIDGVVVQQWYDDGKGNAHRIIGPAV
ncbi:FxsA family protein [Nocardia sp. XZ_19_385]|uniref:FxsA family protein n=1 Tax=Nocardia sp. XZ_19_385 TaxID=2769488 RepID=UPI00188FCA0A|nr:FxsA family protein [Nocardia sp. XZ_19_385]